MSCVFCDAARLDNGLAMGGFWDAAFAVLVVLAKTSGVVDVLAATCDAHAEPRDRYLRKLGLCLTPHGIASRTAPVAVDKRCDNCRDDERPIRLTIDVAAPTATDPAATSRIKLCAVCCRVAAQPSCPPSPPLARVWRQLHAAEIKAVESSRKK